ncbi:hypothetical protein WA026_022567 [Henosepilachna vigintioctopunctata]|uniref:Uncharacterized protein n=1 Tax=Henosepilachna vigintioctopunctata TaxID=420089 RepID=A0AAW1VB15_9CUCU
MNINLRKLTNRRRKTSKYTIYADTPEKEEIRREYENRLKRTKAKQVKKRLDGENTKRNAINKKKFSEENTQQDSSSEEEQCYCVVCTSAYSESRPGKNGYNVQCGSMKSAQKVALDMFVAIVTPNNDITVQIF